MIFFRSLEASRRLGPGVALALLAARPGLARAEDAKRSSLSWTRSAGAESCISTQALARAVEARIGRRVFVSAADADLSVEGRVERAARGFRAQIQVRDGSGALLGVRDFHRDAPGCEGLSDTVAFAIALIIDPDALARPTANEPEADPSDARYAGPVPAPAEAPAPGPAPVPLASPTRDAAQPPPRTGAVSPWSFEGGGAVTAVQGLTPAPGVGGGVDAILYPPGVPVGMRGFATLFLPTTADVDGARAKFDMLLVGGSICPTLRGRRVNLLGCVGGQLGVLRPRAETRDRGISEADRLLWNALVELRASMPLPSPFGVSAGVGAALPLLRPSVDFVRSGSRGTLHEVSAVAFTADVGLGFRFP